MLTIIIRKRKKLILKKIKIKNDINYHSILFVYHFKKIITKKKTKINMIFKKPKEVNKNIIYYIPEISLL